MKAFSFYSDTQVIGGVDIVIDSSITYHELKSRAISFDLEDE